MKTIEQHLQDLFVGKLIEVSTNQQRITVIKRGVCSSINQIETNENAKDVWQIQLKRSKCVLYADLKTDLIEIIE